MTLITLYQALNPSTLPVSLETEEIVLESELPDRLQTINSNINSLENTLTGIMYEPNIYETPATTIDHALNINGNVIADNVASTNKTDIEALQTNTAGITNLTI